MWRVMRNLLTYRIYRLRLNYLISIRFLFFRFSLFCSDENQFPCSIQIKWSIKHPSTTQIHFHISFNCTRIITTTTMTPCHRRITCQRILCMMKTRNWKFATKIVTAIRQRPHSKLWMRVQANHSRLQQFLASTNQRWDRIVDWTIRAETLQITIQTFQVSLISQHIRNYSKNSITITDMDSWHNQTRRQWQNININYHTISAWMTILMPQIPQRILNICISQNFPLIIHVMMIEIVQQCEITCININTRSITIIIFSIKLLIVNGIDWVNSLLKF